jgi:hypothetical protein
LSSLCADCCSLTDRGLDTSKRCLPTGISLIDCCVDFLTALIPLVGRALLYISTLITVYYLTLIDGGLLANTASLRILAVLNRVTVLILMSCEAFVIHILVLLSAKSHDSFSRVSIELIAMEVTTAKGVIGSTEL